MINKQKIETISQQNKGITLIVASKSRTIEEIEAVKKHGVSNFGENYIQEAEDKKDAFDNTKLHMIGRLQSNKSKQAVQLFNVIHTITSNKLANKINKHCIELNKFIDVFIQVNIANEQQKNGVTTKDLAKLVQDIKELSNITLIGFMIIPPKDEDPTKYFKQAKTLLKQYNLSSLSMGMSNDYKEAIKNGATHIRIGTAIFGKRV